MKMKDVYELTNDLMKVAIEKKMENWIPNLPFMLYIDFMKRFNNRGIFGGIAFTGERKDRVSLRIEYVLSERTISGHVDVDEVKMDNGVPRGFKGTVTKDGHVYPLGVFYSLSDVVEEAVGRLSMEGGSGFDALDYFEDIVNEYSKGKKYECNVVYRSTIGGADEMYAKYSIMREDIAIIEGNISFVRYDGLWICRITYDDDRDCISIGKDKDLKTAIMKACDSKTVGA